MTLILFPLRNASGGKFSVVEIKGLVTLIRCSEHGSLASGNLDTTPKGIQNAMLGFMKYLNEQSKIDKKHYKRINRFYNTEQ